MTKLTFSLTTKINEILVIYLIFPRVISADLKRMGWHTQGNVQIQVM
jgi:hypothetical protein